MERTFGTVEFASDVMSGANGIVEVAINVNMAIPFHVRRCILFIPTWTYSMHTLGLTPVFTNIISTRACVTIVFLHA